MCRKLKVVLRVVCYFCRAKWSHCGIHECYSLIYYFDYSNMTENTSTLQHCCETLISCHQNMKTFETCHFSYLNIGSWRFNSKDLWGINKEVLHKDVNETVVCKNYSGFHIHDCRVCILEWVKTAMTRQNLKLKLGTVWLLNRFFWGRAGWRWELGYVMNEQIFASLCLDFSLLILALKSRIAQGVALWKPNAHCSTWYRAYCVYTVGSC